MVGAIRTGRPGCSIRATVERGSTRFRSLRPTVHLRVACPANRSEIGRLVGTAFAARLHMVNDERVRWTMTTLACPIRPAENDARGWPIDITSRNAEALPAVRRATSYPNENRAARFQTNAHSL